MSVSSTNVVEVTTTEEVETQNGAMTAFHNSAHFWGRLTLVLVIIASISLPAYFSFIVGVHPGWGPIIAGLIGYAAFVGIMWVVEPITYFPILGIAGTYIAFLSGNIANLCLPCSAAAQKAIGAKPGTQKAEVAGVLGVALASLTNTVVIILTVLGGTYIISILPEVVKDTFTFILPAIFGAVLGQFSFSTPKYGLLALGIGLVVFFSPVPSFFKVLSCVALTIAIIWGIENRKDKNAA